MKKFLLFALLFAVVVVPAVRADKTEEDAAIRKRHEEWVAAWNKHDPKLMASFWTKDGDLIDPSGKQTKGTQEIEKFFTTEHTGKGIMVGTVYSGTVDSIRYPGKNVAIVDVTAEVTGMKDTKGVAAPPLKHHVTWIAEKKGGKWMAVAARPAIPSAMPGSVPAK